MMKNRLKSIFEFLKENQEYNTKVQTGFYQETLIPYNSSQDKIKSLFWKVQATQSRPRLANVGRFWQEIESRDVSSFKSLLLSLGGNIQSISYYSLFQSLVKQPSWGNKTAALFTRSLYHIHADKRYNHLFFLDDAPKILSKGDRLMLPVDIVISNIFTSLFDISISSFDKINDLIMKEYHREEVALWDDLWFWGFITQKGSGGNRQFSWNEQKYWSLLHTPKDEKSISSVRRKALVFIDLIKS